MHQSTSGYRLATPFFFLVALLFQFSLVGQVWINEFHYDNAGGDTGEFVEIVGVAGTDLSSYSIEFYTGSNGEEYSTITLSGIIPNEGNTGFGAVDFEEAGIQNGAPDGIALVGPMGVIEFISYEGDFMAIDNSAMGTMSTDIGVSEPGSTPVGSSLQLKGSGSSAAEFTWQTPSPGSAGSLNTGQTLLPAAQIGAINYGSLASAISAAAMTTGPTTITLLRDITEGQLDIINTPSLTIDGGGFTFTSTAMGTDRGFEITALDVTIKNLTIQGTPNNAIHTSIGGDGLTVENVTVLNSGKSAIAPACIDDVTLTDITVMGVTGGTGISISSVTNLTLTNYTSSGNGFSPAFQVSIGVFDGISDCTATQGPNGVTTTSGITITGDVNIGEPFVYYTQGGTTVGNTPVVSFSPTSEVKPANLPILTNAEGYLRYYLADAATSFTTLASFSRGNADLPGMAVMMDLDNNNKRLVASDITFTDDNQMDFIYDMSIQTAVNSIPTGEPTVIEIRAGDYPEDVNFGTKEVTVKIGIE